MTAKKRSSNFHDLGNNNTQKVISDKLEDFSKDDLLIGAPAKIISVDDYENLQTVDIELLVAIELVGGTIIEPGKIRKVFVQLESAGGYSFEFPVNVGDIVSLNYSHQGLQKFLDGDGGKVTQSVNELPQLGDCYVTLGFGTRKNNLNPSKTDLRIKGPKSTIVITPSGEVSVTSEGDVTISSDANINLNATTINNNGSTFGVVTTASINPLTGTPYPTGSPTLRNSDG